MKAYIEPYVPQMRDEVINMELRPADVQEVKDSHGVTPRQALEVSLENSSRTWVVKYDNKIIAVFGVCDYLSRKVGVPWLLGTQELHDLKFRIIKYSPVIIKNMLFVEGIDCLTNAVSVKHTEALKWLKWLGFTFMETEFHLFSSQVPFKQFVMWRNK